MLAIQPKGVRFGLYMIMSLSDMVQSPRAREGMNGCVFCQVARGEIRSAIIYEDAEVIGLMDICPIRAGDAQIIPREHFDYFDDLPDVIACRIIHLGSVLRAA